VGAETFRYDVRFDKKKETFCRPQVNGTKVTAGEALRPCHAVWPLLTNPAQGHAAFSICLAPADTAREDAIFMPQPMTVL
jgi:hypothetical protein